MYLMNYHLYANTAAMAQIMAEDSGTAELRNPVFYIRTEYKVGRFQRMMEMARENWRAFWNAPARPEIEAAC